MANKSQSENLQVILDALYGAGQSGLSVDEIKTEVFKDSSFSKTDIKKLLDILKSKGMVQVKIAKVDIRFSLTNINLFDRK
jgi:hypothetical protein